VTPPPSKRQVAKPGDEPSRIDEIKLADKDRLFRQPSTVGTKFSTERASKTNVLWTKQSPYYWHDSQLVNLGYHQNGASRVTVEPSSVGTMSFDSLKVWALPMTDYSARVAKLRANAMTDVEFGTNRVSGTVDSARDGLLFLSIPYTPGWSASVDGRPVETIRVNTTYTGVPVSAGKHTVVLTYMTPGLVPGVIAAIVAVLAFVAVRVVRRRVPADRSGSVRLP